jgi:hypothetical protein
MLETCHVAVEHRQQVGRQRTAARNDPHRHMMPKLSAYAPQLMLYSYRNASAGSVWAPRIDG